MSKSGQYQGNYRERYPGKWEGAVRLGWKDGKRHRVSFYGSTRLEVQRLVADAVKAFQDGGVIKVKRQTLGSFLDDWLEDTVKPTVRPRTYVSYKLMVDTHIRPALGHIELSKLTPQNVQAFLNEKCKCECKSTKKETHDGEPEKPRKILSTRTVLYARAILRRALGQALKWGMVTRNVAALVDPPKMTRKEVQPLDADGAKQLLKVAKGTTFEALFSVGLAVGLRLGEVLGLRWEDVDLRGGTLRVVSQLQKIDGEYRLVEPKSKQSRRVIPLPQQAIDALTDLRLTQEFQKKPAAGEKWRGWGLVFMSELGTPLDERNVRRALYNLLDKANLPRVRFHDLRHTCASLLLAQGVPARVVMEVLGHSQITLTLDTYSHVSTLVLQDAADKMTAALTPKAEAQPVTATAATFTATG